MKSSTAVTLLGLFACLPLYGYETTTHALITQKAFERSVLSASHLNSIIPALGFDRLNPNKAFDLPIVVPNKFPGIFGKRAYFDDVSAQTGFPTNRWRITHAVERHSLQMLLERGFIPSFSDVSDLEGSINGWLMRGAIREDDNDVLRFGVWIPDTFERDQDPYGPILRATRHFYDPVQDLAYPYEVDCDRYMCVKSITWAMGLQDPFLPAGQVPDPNRRNHFTYADARDDYFQSLTRETDANGDGGRSALEREYDAYDRQWRLATMVKSLGQVVHLVQDTAQPQHVRGDAHAPPSAVEDGTREGHNDAAIEAFTNYRILGNARDALASSIPGNPLLHMDETLPNELAVPTVIFGNYPGAGRTIQLTTPVQYFTTRHLDTAAGDCGGTSNVICARRGLADFTNRSFFTAGTLPSSIFCTNPALQPNSGDCTTFRDSPFPFPPVDTADPSYVQVALPSRIFLGPRTFAYAAITRKVIDSVAPDYIDPTLSSFGGRVPLLLKSVAASAASGLAPQVLVNRFNAYSYANIRYTGDVAIPRAIGYSAGLIDFFFRGRLKIEAPVDGLFAAMDHSIPHSVDGFGYPRCTTTASTTVGEITDVWCVPGRIYGFTKIRLKVRNNTPDIIESGTGRVVPQTMVSTFAEPTSGPNAGLFAIARYHRNPCYQPDLSGESTIDANGVVAPPACTPARTTYQEISVSRAKVVTAAQLNSATASAVTFDFTNDPIPINATDLFIQVVYRGTLGEENDGIAVGSMDVREPSYVTVWNNSDWGGCQGAWLRSFPAPCSPLGNTLSVITTANICVGSQILLAHNGNVHGDLLLGKYLRVAVVMDERSLIVRARTVNTLSPVTTNITFRAFRGHLRQSPREIPTVEFPYIREVMFQKRGRISGTRPVPIHPVSSGDPQPPSDQGPLDVGNLLPSFLSTDLPNTATFQFPDTPQSALPPTCPAAT